MGSARAVSLTLTLDRRGRRERRRHHRSLGFVAMMAVSAEARRRGTRGTRREVVVVVAGEGAQPCRSRLRWTSRPSGYLPGGVVCGRNGRVGGRQVAGRETRPCPHVSMLTDCCAQARSSLLLGGGSRGSVHHVPRFQRDVKKLAVFWWTFPLEPTAHSCAYFSLSSSHGRGDVRAAGGRRGGGEGSDVTSSRRW